MERVICVTGKGKLFVRPDTVRLKLEIGGIEKEYSEALRASAAQTETLRDMIVLLGFSGKDLKTLNFDVQSHYESYQDARDKSWKRRFEGYRYTHRMKLEFPHDNVRLGEVLSALYREKVKPEITLEYTVRDPESARNELLAKAVRDSRAKAEILCEASGVKLGEVRTIRYSWATVELISRAMTDTALMAAPCGASLPDMDIEPEDVEMEDDVTVEWSIL